ncbi:DUF6491 family protein [Caulobacter sp. 1776]|uniref:DUF6491 family protein n=1 Tax=Caulobacter sp. 1776 TaxID=3156420 RepID=UPI00339407EB
MKTALFAIGAVLALGAAPVMAQQAQQQPQVFDDVAQANAYSNARPGDRTLRCFDGRYVAAANRSGDRTLYVQNAKGGIYRLQMANDCDGLNAAQKISVRTNDGSNLVCAGDAAEMIAKTAAGARRCPISDVQRLSPRDVSALSTAPRR